MSRKKIIIGNSESDLKMTSRGREHEVENDGRVDRIEVISVRGHEAELRVNGRREVVPFFVDGDVVQFVYRGQTLNAEVSSRGRGARPRHRGHSMSAPMPGVVLKIFVALGDVVSKGAPLLILEAMKMEHQISAPHDGTVKEIRCGEGELVQPGVDLITLEKVAS